MSLSQRENSITSLKHHLDVQIVTAAGQRHNLLRSRCEVVDAVINARVADQAAPPARCQCLDVPQGSGLGETGRPSIEAQRPWCGNQGAVGQQHLVQRR
jgi:hypothetical protein